MNLTVPFNGELKSQPLSILRNRNFRFDVILVGLTCLLWSTTAFGQMGQYAVYSDKWLDDSDPMNVQMIGSGVTQDSANYYGHTYWVVTTITSPNGRTAATTSSQSSSYTRAEINLSVNRDDMGTYNVQSSHWLCCPYMGGNPYTGAGCYPSSSTSASLPISLKSSGWKVVGETLTSCMIVATCSGTCVSIGESYDLIKDPPAMSCSSGGIYYQVEELYAFGTCWHTTRIGTNRMFPGVCD
jgi:hypothetical protein